MISGLPATVAPASTATLQVHATPSALRQYRSRVFIHSDGGLQFAVVTMTGAPQPDCEDGNPCTVGTFDPTTNQCQTTFADGNPCESADRCIIDSFCSQGVCLGHC